MKLEYVHWDNFRFLTGLDKQFANVVNDIMSRAIANEIGARNKPQVQRLLSGSTYSRIA